MQYLTCPSRAEARNDLVCALTGIGNSSYPVTDDQLTDVVTLYDCYDIVNGLSNAALKGDTLVEALREAIRSAYDLTQEGRRLRSIRSSLMRGVEFCPICGISAPHELDHYLPKSIFPTPAIYVRNFIPICGICNKKKIGAVEHDGAGGFVHVYFGEYLEERILTAGVSIEDGGLIVEFGIDPEVEMSEDVRGKLTYYLQRFDLNKRYAREFNVYMAGHSTGLSVVYQAGGAAAVRKYLDCQTKVEETCFYINHWRPVLLSSLSEHENFCEGGFRDVLPSAQPLGVLPVVQ